MNNPATLKTITLSVPLGPVESTPQIRAANRRSGVRGVREKLSNVSKISVKTWIDIGNELTATKKDAEGYREDGVTFKKLFPAKKEEYTDETKYPFCRQTGEKLMVIAAKCAHWAHFEKLPSSWRTLYELCRLNPRRIEALIKQGVIHPGMTRGEATAIDKPKKPAKPRVKKAKVEGDPWDTAKHVFEGIKDPHKRAEEFLNLMRDCGITMEQLEEANHE